ncbi:MAG: hypothetical protein J5779_03185 [Clostridia bacterium]|nr:hypothetical protein [Clostridia bacterium]
MDIAKILEYQNKDTELYKIENEIAKSEFKKNYQEMIGIVKQAQEKSAQLEKRAGDILNELKNLEKNFKENSANLEKLSNKANKELNLTEIESVFDAIENVENNLNVLEKKILQTAEKLNVSLNEFEYAKKNYGTAKAKYAENKTKYDNLVSSKQAEIEDLKKTLAGLEKNIEPKIFAKYKQLRQDKIFPVFAPLQDKSCGICMLELSSAQVDKVKTQGYLECDNCHRIIYIKK